MKKKKKEEEVWSKKDVSLCMTRAVFRNLQFNWQSAGKRKIQKSKIPRNSRVQEEIFSKILCELAQKSIELYHSKENDDFYKWKQAKQIKIIVEADKCHLIQSLLLNDRIKKKKKKM